MINLIGQSLGRYHIIEQLGEGGMASVYKAFDTRLERNVAVKVILPSRGQNQEFLKRFEREARALAQLSHPNIVKVLDYGDQDGIPYLIMEFVPGGTLKKKLGQPISWKESAALLAPIARALKYAHEQKIIHRDVKPANILLTRSGEPMLSDFGIAKILEAEETLELTGTGMAIGTPEYMAPEQVLGEGVDHRADIYALGVVFYEMVTGRSPYRADTPVAVMLKKTIEPLPRPGQFVPAIPENVEDVLVKVLEKEPDNRYQDMGSFAKALENIASEKAPDTTRIVPREKATQQVAAKPARPFWLAGGIGLAMFCLIVVIALIVFSGKGLFDNLGRRQSASQTKMFTAVPTSTRPAMLSSLPTATLGARKTPTPVVDIYYPLVDCAPSRLHLNDSAYVGYGGGRNAIRSEPDTHPSDNKIGFAEAGEVLMIVGGPECSYGWIMWEVRTINGLQGWTSENNGTEFFLEPIIPRTVCSGQPKSRLHIGDQAIVAPYPPTANRVMDGPGTNNNKIGVLNPSEGMKIVDGPQCNDGWVWWKVSALNKNLVGWTREGDRSDYYLVPIIPAP